MIKKIIHNNEIISIIGSVNYNPDSTEFITEEKAILQVGYISYPSSHKIKPHKHIPYDRTTIGTNEFLILKEGKVRLNLYTDSQEFLESHILNKGDWVLLCGGSHGFDMIEKSIMIEVKNGPFAGKKDKIRFD